MTVLRRLAERSGVLPGGRARGGAGAALVLVLLGVVALASRVPLSRPRLTGASAGGPPPVGPPPASLEVVILGAGVALFGLFVYARLHAAPRKLPGRRRAHTTPWLIRILALGWPALIATVLVVAAINGAHRRPPAHRGPNVGGLHAHVAASSHAAGTAFDLPAWAQSAIALIVAAGVLLLAASLLARTRPGRPSAAPAGAVRAAVDASLEDLRSEPDARHAVIAAYSRMEATLAALGLGRRAAEAPREYLARALGSLELSAGPPSTLTDLFERARFSLRRIDAPLRDEAIAALLEIRRELDVVTEWAL
jgi:hypothetical protein